MQAPSASVARAHELARPAWIVFPQYVAGAAPDLQALAPARAFMQLAQNGFNYNQLGSGGFDALARLVDTTDSFTFHYSALDDALVVFNALPRQRQVRRPA
jgi:hypothetical protein